MTPEEQELVDVLRANNRALRIKLAAAEAIAKERDEMAFSRDEFRTLYMAAAERLSQAHAVLEAGGLLDKLPPVKAPEVREKENDQRTPTLEKGFTR